MSEPLLPPPNLEDPFSSPTKWEREYRAFRQLLPQLLTTHRGRYVAVHEGRVVDSGDDKLALALRVFAAVGNVPIHVGLVTNKPEPVSCSGVRRELQL